MKTVLYFPSYNYQKFSVKEIEPQFFERVKKIAAISCQIPSREILNVENFQITLRQIEYYKDTGFFTSKTELELLYDKLHEMVNHMEKLCETGKKYMPGQKPLQSDGFLLSLTAREVLKRCNAVGMGAVSTPDFCSMSFLKVERKSSGTYLRIIESYRDDQGQTRHRIVHSLGKVEDYTPEQLRQIGIRLYELGGGDIKALLEGNTEEVGRYNYGYYQIYRKAFKYYELDHLIRRIAARWKVSFDLDSAVMLMLLERLQEPC